MYPVYNNRGNAPAPMNPAPPMTPAGTPYAQVSPFAAGYDALAQSFLAQAAGQVPRQGPVAAMQAAHAQNVNAQQHAQLADARLQRIAQRNNPAAEFEELKRLGHIPPETTYMEYMAMSRRTTQPAALQIAIARARARNNALPPDQRLPESEVVPTENDIDLAQRGNQVIRGPGESVYTMQGNNLEEIFGPEQARIIEAALSGSRADATNDSGTTFQRIGQLETEIPQIYDEVVGLNTSIDRAQQALDLIEGDEVDTNLIRGVMATYFGIGNEAMGELMSLSTEELLNSLQQATLTPVTDRDVITLQRMFADVMSGEAINVGRLTRFLEGKQNAVGRARNRFNTRLRELELLDSAGMYFQSAMDNYGTEIDRMFEEATGETAVPGRRAAPTLSPEDDIANALQRMNGGG